jgi:hypothetical protein
LFAARDWMQNNSVGFARSMRYLLDCWNAGQGLAAAAKTKRIVKGSRFGELLRSADPLYASPIIIDK